MPQAPESAEYTLRLFDNLKDVPRAAWDALLGEAAPPFLSWDWLQALEEAGCVCPEQGWLPMHLTVWRKPALPAAAAAASGLPATGVAPAPAPSDVAGKEPASETLVAAAPAYLKGNSQGEFVFDWAWADLANKLHRPYYPKLIVAVPFTPATGPRRLVHPALPAAEAAAVRRLLIDGVRATCDGHKLSSAHVLFPAEAEADEWASAGLARRLGVQFHWRNEGYRSFDDFLGRFNSKHRNTLRRERAEVRKAGLVVATRRGPFSAADLDAMHRFYAATVDKFFYGRRYLNRRFFELVAERLPDHLEFVAATHGTGPDAPLVGGAINLYDPKARRLYGRYWGQDPGAPGDESNEGAGHRFLHFEVCYYHSIEECIARGATVFEPGAGGEHKLSRGFAPTLTYSAHHLRDRQMNALIRDFLAREEAAIRDSVAQALADSTLRASPPRKGACPP